MPARILESPRDIGTDAPSSPPFASMLAEYYRLRQWDPQTGAIAPEVLDRFGIHRVMGMWENVIQEAL